MNSRGVEQPQPGSSDVSRSDIYSAIVTWPTLFADALVEVDNCSLRRSWGSICAQRSEVSTLMHLL